MAKKPSKRQGLKSLVQRKNKRKIQPVKLAKQLVKGEPLSDDSGDSSSSSIRITNDSVARHREEVLSGARRFIYPLQHSKHKIAIISAVIFGAITVFMLILSWFMLYRQQSTSDFAYRITQVVPFPVARVSGSFVSYEEYLFELRQNMHYLAHQENVDFNNEEGKFQLVGLKQQAMERVLDRAIIRKMAAEHNLEVSSQEVEEQISLIRSQSGVGEGTQTLEDTLKDFYGWGLNDLRRVIKNQILSQKLVPLLDTDARVEAEQVLADINNGEDFGKAAADHSDDDLTADKNGVIGYVFRSNTDLPPQLVEKSFSLAADEVSGDLVQTLFGLHIVKTLSYRSPDEAQIAHILFRYQNIEKFVDARQDQIDTSRYIKIETPVEPQDQSEDTAPAVDL